MLAQLHAHRRGSPQDHVLHEIVASELDLIDALCRLAAFHQASGERFAELRETEVRVGEHRFPWAADVPVLMALLFRRLEALWGEAESCEDDLRVAAFALWAITAIHPFTNGNGRAGLDFAQLLLMHRWSLAAAPIAWPKQAEKDAGSLLSALDDGLGGEDHDVDQGLTRLREALFARLADTKLEHLRAHPSFSALAAWMATLVRV